MDTSNLANVSQGRLNSLQRLEERILHAMMSTTIPDLSVDEIVILQNGSFMEKPRAKKDPKAIVIEWCEAEKHHVIEMWEMDQQYFSDETAPTPPDTSNIDAFIERIREWSMMGALMIVKIFEDLDALDLTVLRLTPEAIHRLLEDTRAYPKWT